MADPERGESNLQIRGEVTLIDENGARTVLPAEEAINSAFEAGKREEKNSIINKIAKMALIDRARAKTRESGYY